MGEKFRVKYPAQALRGKWLIYTCAVCGHENRLSRTYNATRCRKCDKLYLLERRVYYKVREGGEG